MLRKVVCYLTPLYFDEQSCLGGGERYPLNLARGVVRAGGGSVRAEILSFGARSFTRELADGLTLRVLPVAGKPANPLDVLSWELPAALARADLLHIHQAYTRCAEMGLLVARPMGIPICVTDHGGFSSPLGVEIGALELADQVVAYSDFGASFYRTRQPIAVIKGGVDAELFRPPAVRPPRTHALFVGRLLPHKGVDRLIEALPAGVPLTVCGRPYNAEYHSHLRALAAGKPVTFRNDAGDEEIAGLYASAFATVLPSVYRDCYGNVHTVPELMGFTLLESMACGTPAIASRTAAMPEFVDDGVTGFVYDTPAELAERLGELAADPARADAMGHAAREAVERRFSLEVAGAELLALYRRLWASRPSHEAAA